MNRYLQFFLGLICFVTGLFFWAIQSGIYVTTLYGIMGYVFFVSGLLILGNLSEKNFFYIISSFIKKIWGWRNGKYESTFVYLTVVISLLLFVGLIYLVILLSNILL